VAAIKCVIDSVRPAGAEFARTADYEQLTTAPVTRATARRLSKSGRSRPRHAIDLHLVLATAVLHH
jgi:hypothetical protein